MHIMQAQTTGSTPPAFSRHDRVSVVTGRWAGHHGVVACTGYERDRRVVVYLYEESDRGMDEQPSLARTILDPCDLVLVCA